MTSECITTVSKMKMFYFFNYRFYTPYLELVIPIIKSKFNTYLINIIFLGLISCSHQDDAGDSISQNKVYDLIESRVVNLTLDNETSRGNIDIQFLEVKNKKYVYMLNRSRYFILIYDWDTRKLIQKILLDKEGPHGVGLPVDLYVKSKDSLYILSRYTYLLSLLNDRGKVIDKYRLLKSTLPFNTKDLAPPAANTVSDLVCRIFAL